MPRFAPPLLLLALCLAPPRALAWHQAGHMTIARIAYEELTEPQKLQVARILKAHPHYQRFLLADRPAGVSEAEWAFLRASFWPDWVRSDWTRYVKGEDRPDAEAVGRKYHRGPWHYINLPIVLPDAPQPLPKLPAPDYDAQGEPGHVLTALKKSMTLLRAADMPDEVKAVYLCWLLHLVGDLHQPLHASTLVSQQFPYGDLGGNLFLVSPRKDGPAVNLHFFWDAQLFAPGAGFKEVEAKAEELRRAPDLQRDQLPELKAGDFKAWAEESFALAKTVGYRDGKLAGRRSKGKENLAEVKAPPLPDDYAATAARVSARRMALAGYRLADQLAVVFKKD